KHESVEAAQNTENPLDMTCYKSLHGVPPEGRVDLGNIGPSYFTSDAVSTSARLPLACSVSSVPLWRRCFLLAAPPRCASVASVWSSLLRRCARGYFFGLSDAIISLAADRSRWAKPANCWPEKSASAPSIAISSPVR